MTAPYRLVPCLVELRAEVDAIAPGRDRGADGWIADEAHYARGTSKHIPNRYGWVRALDIDSTGPWPAGAELNDQVEHIRQQHRQGRDHRLRNIIWRGRISSKTWGWSWKPYGGVSAHFDHAHFEADDDPAHQHDDSPFGLLGLVRIPESLPVPQEDPMPELVKLTAACAERIGKKAGEELELGLLVQYAIIGAYDARDAIRNLRDLREEAKPGR